MKDDLARYQAALKKFCREQFESGNLSSQSFALLTALYGAAMACSAGLTKDFILKSVSDEIDRQIAGRN